MRHIFLAFTNPVAGREAEFNDWYDLRHVPELLRYGRGFTGCQRFILHDEPLSGPLAPWKYLALYDLDCEDLTSLSQQFLIAGSPPLTPFHGLLEDDHVGWIFTPHNSQYQDLTSGERSSQPFELLLAWSVSTLADAQIERGALEAKYCTGVRFYDLASPQRPEQLESPWRGLQICELPKDGVIPKLNGSNAAWRFTPISRYTSRSDV
jgi:hypothetical protein